MAQHHYLSKTSELSEARFQKFLKDFAGYEAVWLKATAQDRFLDAYSIWMRHRSPVTYENLLQAIVELRRLDPSFRFPLPSSRDMREAFNA